MVICGLVSYLFQALNSTPVKVASFIKDALYSLRYGAMMSEFGVFFIHGLDLELEGVIPEIRQKDSHFVSFEARIKVYKGKVRDYG